MIYLYHQARGNTPRRKERTMKKSYKCYYGSDVDFDFVVTFLANRDMLTDDHIEIIENSWVELPQNPNKTMGYRACYWEYYHRVIEFCQLAGEYRSIAAQENYDEWEREEMGAAA